MLSSQSNMFRSCRVIAMPSRRSRIDRIDHLRYRPVKPLNETVVRAIYSRKQGSSDLVFSPFSSPQGRTMVLTSLFTQRVFSPHRVRKAGRNLPDFDLVMVGLVLNCPAPLLIVRLPHKSLQ